MTRKETIDKRNETIDKMIKMAKAITGPNSERWTRSAENEIWTMCCDWNSDHYEETGDDGEIFMCEFQSEDNEWGFMIEDDYFIVYE